MRSLALALLVVGSVVRAESQPATDGGDWQRDWALRPEYTIDLDTSGYHYPTSIAFIPEPGTAPSDPLYFVTELRGKVKVVTNDRTVHTFAEGFLQTEYHDEAPPSGAAEFGLAGICLDPVHGYVFVTFTYQDEMKVLRNSVVRFDSRPGVFSTKAGALRPLASSVLAIDESGRSHQIGNCRVAGAVIYIGVGDGFRDPTNSQSPDSLLGKLIRMSVDGAALADNPFYDAAQPERPANYVWALGLRNPFALAFAGSRLLVADNGLHLDRFIEIVRGRNYLWNGNDASIATNALHVFDPGVGPVQMDYLSDTNGSFPESLRSSFFIATSSLSRDRRPGIYRVPYAQATGLVSEVPSAFVEGVGEGGQPLTGVAFGPDGLYFAPLLPVRDETAAILKVRYAPGHQHAALIGPMRPDHQLLREKGCFGCHKLKERFRDGGTKGPELDRGEGEMLSRIRARLDSPAYRAYLVELDSMDRAPMNDFKEARQEVLNATGLEQERLWLKYQVLEPRFANPNSTMPSVGLSLGEADAIATYLTSKANQTTSWQARVKSLLPPASHTQTVLAALLGFIVALPIFALIRIGWVALRR